MCVCLFPRETSRTSPNYNITGRYVDSICRTQREGARLIQCIREVKLIDPSLETPSSDESENTEGIYVEQSRSNRDASHLRSHHAEAIVHSIPYRYDTHVKNHNTTHAAAASCVSINLPPMHLWLN